MKEIVVAGVAQCGSVYPNAQRTLAVLRNAGVTIIDQAHWLPPNTQLWQVAQKGIGARLRMTVRLLWSSFVQAVRVLTRSRGAAMVYVPYPSLFLLWWLSWVPRSRRPFLVADVYISIWDSMFRDRSKGRQNSLPSRLIRATEKRALRAADRVLVDTDANAHELATIFGLPEHTIRSLPLAIDESRFLAIAPQQTVAAKRMRVLFIGTMIPLHGIEVVLEAMQQLRDDDRVEFRLVGDGQLGAVVERALHESGSTRATWLRGHYGLDVLAREIADADVCLGVFGGSGKAARVLPFKLYLYFAAGRAVISQAQLSTPAAAPYPPIEPIERADAASLASTIIGLLENPHRRAALARSSREYYVRWLSNARLREAWEHLLDPVSAAIEPL